MNYFVADTGDQIPIISDISIKMISPLFERKNTYTYPLTFFATPDIDILFERARLVDSKNNKVREISGELRLGIFRFNGMLRIFNTSGNKYNGNFTGQGSMNTLLNKQMMNELDLGSGTLFDYETTFFYTYQEHILQVDNEDAFCFIPYVNDKWLDNFEYSTVGWPNVINRYHSSRYRFPVLSPSFIVDWIISKIIELNGIEISENALKDSIYDGLIMLPNYSDISLEFIEKQDSGAIVSFSSIVKNDDTVSLQVSDITLAISNSIYIKLYDLTGSIFNCEGRIFEILDKDYENNLIEINGEPDLFDNVTSGKFICLAANWVYPETFEVKNHMPDVSVLNFLRAINSVTGTITIFDETKNSCRILKLKDIVNSFEYTDITDYAGKISEIDLNEIDGYAIKFEGTTDEWFSERVTEPGITHSIKDEVSSVENLPLQANHNDIRLVEDKQQYFIWERSPWGSRQSYNDVAVYLGNWRFFSDNFIRKYEGSEELKIDLSAIPLANDTSVSIYTQDKIIPRMDIPINTDETKEKSDPGIRIMFFNELTDNYPLAKANNDELSLHINGTNGIYEVLYKDWIEWNINRYREAKSVINWPLQLINSFKWEEKFRIQNTNYLVKEINFKVKPDGKIIFGDSIMVRI